MADVGKLLVELEARTAKFDKAMQQSRAQLRRIERGSRQTQQSVRDFGRSFDQAAVKIGRITASLGVFGGALAGVGLASLTRGTIAYADAIGKTADRVGVGVEALQELRFAAELTGIGQRQLDIGLQRFSRRIAQAAQGSGELAKVFKTYGIALRDSNGGLRTTESILSDYADAVKSATSDQEALRLAFVAFDSEGAALVNTLRGGSDGLNALRARAIETGAVIEEELVRNAERFNDQWTEVSRRFQGTIGSAILRGFTIIADEGTSIVTFLFASIEKGLARTEFIWQQGWAGIGATLIEAFAAFTAPVRTFFQFIADGFDRLAQLGSFEIFGQQVDITPLTRISDALDGLLDKAPKVGEAYANVLAGDEGALQARLDAIDAHAQGIIRSEQATIRAREAARELRGEWRQAANLGDVYEPVEKSAKKASRAVKGLSDEQRALNALQREATQVFQQTRTPLERYEEQLKRLNELRQAARDGLVRNFGEDTYTRAVIEAQDELTEALRRQGEELKRVSKKAEEQKNEMTEFAKQAARNMQDAFADFLFDPFEGGLKGMADGFAETLRRMAAEAASASLFDRLGGFLGGLNAGSRGGAGPDIAGGGGGLLGSLLGGVFGRQHGGPVQAGQPYLVGERGPELIVPRQNGTVLPTGTGQTINVVNNINVAAPEGRLDRRTIDQISSSIGTGMQRALERNN